MKVPLSWLRDYVAVDASPEEIAHRLSISTAEVNEVVRRGVPDENGNLDLYRVGRVIEAGRHPNADRLQLCRVDVGEREPRQIVCGAWNFGAGAHVAVALPGAVFPDGMKLERAKLRGETSDGMILSERELELGHDHTGILVLPETVETGAPLSDVFPLGDVVLDVEPTGNRPDLLAVYGIAREVAALFGVELAPPHGGDWTPGLEERVDVDVQDLDGCPRYIGRVFRDVRVRPSSPWLKARITAAGMRPISNVVDVTNYVMLDLGNPLHAFDRAKLAEGRIVVRRARAGEELVTLDGQLRKLDPRDLVIADAERAVALAGIMGGSETEVTDATTEVLLEAANFEPVGILQSSERHALRTEGSNRWEKGVDPYLAEQAARLATDLLIEEAGVRWAGETDVKGVLPEPPVVRLRPARASELIGLDVPEARQRDILARLGFEQGDGAVTVPTWRARDVRREVDLIEEVARFVLEEVPFTLPRRQELFGRLARSQRLRRTVEDVLVGAGFYEVYTPSLVPVDDDPRAIRLPEPLSSEYAALRTTLRHGLVEAARHNIAVGNDGIALFELARVYLPGSEKLPDERWHAGAVAEGGFAPAKAALDAIYEGLRVEAELERVVDDPFLHPGKAARTPHGVVGELHPARLEGRWGFLELDLDALFAAAPERFEVEDVIELPAVRQDLAFVVDEDVPAAALAAAMREAAGPELRDVRAFDEYRGEQTGAGKKSIAFAVAFQSPERTLTDEDAEALRSRIVAALRDRFGAILRA